MKNAFRIRSISARRWACILATATAGGLAQAQPADYSSGVVYERLRVDYAIARDGSFTRTSESVKRIESEAGVQKEGRFSVPFREGAESVEVLDARVVKPDGTALRVGADAMFVQAPQAAADVAFFSDAKLQTIVFPDVTPGSRIMLKYRLLSRQPIFAGHFSSVDWVSIHARRPDVQFTFSAPRDLPLQVAASDMALERSQSGETVRWTAKAAVTHPVAPEPGSVAAIDYSPRVTASTFADFQAFSRIYAPFFQSPAKVTPAIQSLADSITKDAASTSEQARALYEWVAKNIRYVAVQIGKGGWIPHDAEGILQRRYGDCKDHVVLLEALLRAKGIDSSPALINAGNAWWSPGTATPQAFNHAITYVPALDLFLDSTARYADFGTLPFEAADKPVLILAPGRWARTAAPAGATNHTAIKQRIGIAEDGAVRGTVEGETRGPSAIIGRALYASLRHMPNQQMVSAILSQSGESGTGELVRPDPDALGQPLQIRLDYQLSNRLDFKRPGAWPLARGAQLGGILSFVRGVGSAPRKLPFVCPAFSMAEETELSFPSTAHLGSLPDPITIRSDRADVPVAYTSTYARQGERIVVRRQLHFDTKQMVCRPEAYARLQGLVRQIEQDYAGQVSYR